MFVCAAIRSRAVLFSVVIAGALGITSSANALPRDPAVSGTQIAFVEASQLWVMPRSGGLASRVSDLPGRKFTPRFSPDGQRIAFSSNEAQGEINLYTMALNGGSPKRITFIPSHQNLTQWTLDNRLVFHTNSLSFSPIEMQLFTVPESGGLPTLLPVAYGSDGVIDDSGEWLAYTPKWQISLISNWRRYRGGSAPDIWLVNLRTHASRRITDWEGSDFRPMWHGTTLYYLSDEGSENRLNLWAYDMPSGTHQQVTHFEEYDVRNASIGPDAIVFELGPKLRLLDLTTGTTTPVQTEIPQPPSLQRDIDADGFITNRQVLNGGKQVLIEARGDLWLAGVGPNALPARNLTSTSGAFEREASISPDGKRVAFWSDATGEYQLYIRELTGSAQTKPLTHFPNGFRYRPVWSPDSRRLAFADQRGALVVFDVAHLRVTPADTDPWAEPTELAWSADSKWLAYVRTGANRLTTIWRYDRASGKRQRLTAEGFNASTPVFVPNGERVFFISYRNFSNPNVDWIQQRITHRGTATLMTIPLHNLAFDADSFERAGVRLNTTPGSITALGATQDGDPIYTLSDFTGKVSVRRYDMRKQEEVEVKGTTGFVLSPDGHSILVDREGKTFVHEVGDSAESALNTTGMVAHIDLRQEWRELYQDAWRYYRDFFYAPRIGLRDWDFVRIRYLAMIERCLTRNEVNVVLGEMIGQSSVGHAYVAQSGDVGTPPPPSTVGMLGADFELERGAFRITHIYEGAPWDDRSRSPLREAAIGDFLLAVNGKPIDTGNDPRAAFVGLAGKQVQVTIGPHPQKDSSSREIPIKPLSSENDQRRRAWIEANRKHIAEESNGRIGYIHAPDYSTSGFNEFESQFSGQTDKNALIIDARWSSGGWVGAILAENLARPPLVFQAIRESDEVWPAQRWGAHFGPKALIVNYITVSAGESFAYFFRKLGLGPLIGSRTWGGSTGLNPVPSLIDGGYVNVPNAPFYDETGWIWEGHGLDPDVLVEPDPAAMVTEGDAQLEAAIKAMLKALESKPYHPPTKPH